MLSPKNGFTFFHVYVHAKRLEERYWTCRIFSSQLNRRLVHVDTLLHCYVYTEETNSTVEHTLYYSHYMQAVAATGITRSSQLSSPLPGQAEQYDKADGTARPLQYKSCLHPLLQQGRAGRRIGSILYDPFGLCALITTSLHQLTPTQSHILMNF
jgi:hypothetical protein